jgi:hypothetical protein
MVLLGNDVPYLPLVAVSVGILLKSGLTWF